MHWFEAAYHFKCDVINHEKSQELSTGPCKDDPPDAPTVAPASTVDADRDSMTTVVDEDSINQDVLKSPHMESMSPDDGSAGKDVAMYGNDKAEDSSKPPLMEHAHVDDESNLQESDKSQDQKIQPKRKGNPPAKAAAAKTPPKKSAMKAKAAPKKKKQRRMMRKKTRSLQITLLLQRKARRSKMKLKRSCTQFLVCLLIYLFCMLHSFIAGSPAVCILRCCKLDLRFTAWGSPLRKLWDLSQRCAARRHMMLVLSCLTIMVWCKSSF